MELSTSLVLTNKKHSGKGKMPEGTEFYTFYRVEADADGATAADTSFNPSELEA